MEGVNERIRELRTELGLNQSEFGERIGVKKSVVSTMESGRTNLTARNTDLICKEFNVSREWLLNGTGEMFLPESSDSLDALAEQYDLTPLEREIFENYCKLSKAQRLAFWDVMQKIVGSSAQSGSAEESAPGSGVAAAEAAYEKNFGTASGTPDAEATSMHEDTG